MSQDATENFHLELSNGFWARLRGLMFKNLDKNQALLIPNCRAVHTCFVRGPLDIIFLDKTGHVRAVRWGLAPWRWAADQGASHVLEMPGGAWEKIGPHEKEGLLARVREALKTA